MRKREFIVALFAAVLTLTSVARAIAQDTLRVEQTEVMAMDSLKMESALDSLRTDSVLDSLRAIPVTQSTDTLTGKARWKWRMKMFLATVQTMLSIRYNKINTDTLYIVRPKTWWTIRGRFNVSGAGIKTEGMDDGMHYLTEMKANYKGTLSVAVGYMGLTLSFSLNPAKMLGKYQDYEFNLNSYSNRWGFDFIYQRASNFKGYIERDGASRMEIETTKLKLRTINFNAYYAFNYKRFSYPAAFSQSYIQRRSAGSFLLGLSLQGQYLTVEASEHLAGKNVELRTANHGIGAGYGYNFVPGRNWLLHISALPTFIIISKTSLYIGDEKISMPYRFPAVIIVGRGAVVKQFGRWFAGLSMVYNFTSIGDEDMLMLQNQKWRARLFVGVRLSFLRILLR